MKRWIGLAAALLAAMSAFAVEEHGKTDAYAGHGVALAWAVARGPTEPATTVVIRVVTEGAPAALSVTGRDPFTNAEEAWLPRTAIKGRHDVRVSRARFADYPRTELRFFTGSETRASLLVYYLGIPDTTPEFDDPARLDAYLDERIARARTGAKRP